MKKHLFAGILWVAASQLLANDGFYWGAGYGLVSGNFSSKNQTETTKKSKVTELFVGRQLTNNMAMELRHSDFSEFNRDARNGYTFTANGTTTTVPSGVLVQISSQSKSTNLSGIFSLPINTKTQLTAKLGVHRYKINTAVTSALGNFSSNKSDNDFLYGLGIVRTISADFGVRTQLERFLLNGDSTDILSVSFKRYF